MTTRVQKSIMVNVPVSVAYNQWTQFEDFPQFMGGVQSVTQLSDDRLQWVAEIAGVRRQWEAKILEQVPDRKVAWAATEGATNAGSVEFEDLGGGQTSVTLFLEYEPEGVVEKVGDKLNVVEKQAESDLEKFKSFIESEGYATGAWRGEVNAGAGVGTPGVEQAASSRGDEGKAGVSGTAVAAGLGAAAVAGAAAAAASRSGSSNESASDTEAPGPVEAAPMEAAPMEAASMESAPVEPAPVQPVSVEGVPVEGVPLAEPPVGTAALGTDAGSEALDERDARDIDARDIDARDIDASDIAREDGPTRP